MDFKKLNVPRRKMLDWRMKADAMFISHDSRKRALASLLKGANSADPEDLFISARVFFGMFLWTYNPKVEPGHFPFALWEYQDKFLEDLCWHFIEGKPMIVEKSRDMGATWVTCGFMAFLFLYRKNFNGHIIGKKEDDLDNGCIDTVFPKIEHMIENLPNWLRPDGWCKEDHIRFMKFTHPLNLNSITGESANPHAGRSRRYHLIFFDEFAMNPNGHAIWKGTQQTCKCRIAVSTPLGMNNKFAELRHSGRIDVHTMHWRDHPNKDQKWYDEQCAECTEQEIASELDISYHNSQQGIVYKEFEYKSNVKQLEYDPELPLFCSWDFGIGDSTVILWIQTKGNEVRIIDGYQDKDKSIDFYVPFILGEFPPSLKGENKYPYKMEATRQIAEHRKWKKPTAHFGDPDCKKTSLTDGESVYDVLRRSEINIRYKRLTVKDRINLTKKVLRKPFYVNEKLKWLVTCFENYHWPIDDNTGDIKESINMKPVHDKYSHAMTAFEFFCVNWRPGMGYIQQSIDNQMVSNSTFGY